MASPLEVFGVTSDVDSGHLFTVEQSEFDADVFYDRAKELLGAISDDVRNQVIPQLEHYLGRWHPNGFMVFPLGTTPNHSTLRLHIWPTTQRIGAEKGLTIHDHAWHLASKVLEGVYVDKLYDVKEVPSISEQERVKRGLLRVYGANYIPDKPELIATDGTCVDACLMEERVVKKNELHTIAAGIYHSTNIAEDELVATLVIDSPRLSTEGPYILVDSPPRPFYEHRAAISLEDKLHVKAQLQNA